MSVRERLLAETREAWQGSSAARAEVDRQRARPPAPGDLFVLAQSAEGAVEWAILDRDAEGRLLAVPADANVLVGSADVVCVQDGVPLVLRCAFAVRLAGGRFERGRRSGAVAPADVEGALARCSALDRGERVGSVLEHEVDQDPEYHDWVEEVLEPARRDVLGGEGAAVDDTGAQAPAEEPSAEPPAEPLRGPWGHRVAIRPGAWYLVAASILLAVGAGLGSGLLWRHNRALERQLAAARLAGAAVANPVLAQLDLSAGLRGDLEQILPPSASHLILFFRLGDTDRSPAYRLEVIAAPSGAAVWVHSGLRRSDYGEVMAGIPAAALPAGEYRLRLFGLGEQQERLLGDHGLRVEEGSEIR